MRQKDDNKYILICETAVELITTTGFENTSMSKIAKNAGISASTIYVYFENKEDMINELYLYCHRKILQSINLDLDKTISVKEQIYRIYSILSSCIEQGNFYIYFIEQFQSSPLISHIVHMEISTIFQKLHNFFVWGIENGQIKKVQPEILANIIFGPMVRLIQNKKMMKINLPDNYLDIAFELSWSAVSI